MSTNIFKGKQVIGLVVEKKPSRQYVAVRRHISREVARVMVNPLKELNVWHSLMAYDFEGSLKDCTWELIFDHLMNSPLGSKPEFKAAYDDFLASEECRLYEKVGDAFFNWANEFVQIA